MAFLLGMSECVKGRKFEIDSDSVSVGRSSDNDLVIEHETISSKHCVLERVGDVYKLVDKGSTNGTMVNSETISERELKPGDVIQFGAVEFVFDGEELKVSDDRPDSLIEIIAADKGLSAGPPKSFSSVSPFGTRKKQNKNFWVVALVVIGLLALTGVGFLVFKLLF